MRSATSSATFLQHTSRYIFLFPSYITKILFFSWKFLISWSQFPLTKSQFILPYLQFLLTHSNIPFTKNKRNSLFPNRNSHFPKKWKTRSLNWNFLLKEKRNTPPEIEILSSQKKTKNPPSLNWNSLFSNKTKMPFLNRNSLFPKRNSTIPNQSSPCIHSQNSHNIILKSQKFLLSLMKIPQH